MVEGNNFILDIITAIQKQKSQIQLNKDIKSIQKQLNKLELKAEIDPSQLPVYKRS